MLIKIKSDAPKFQCNACGSCCSHIRGIIAKEDLNFIRENAYGKLPVVQIVPPEQMTFPLWDWEAKRFREWQNEANVDANISPLRAILDLNSNKAIILTYFMNSKTDACPFLREKKCSIYHTQRAYVCRLFPFNRSPFISQDKEYPAEGMFGECGAMEKILPQVPKDFAEMIKFLNEAFPDGSFLNAVQNDLIIEWENKTIIDLMKKNIIKPAINYPYNFLLRRFKNAEKIDFTDFLLECNYLTLKERERLIKRFDNNLDAKEKIIEFVR